MSAENPFGKLNQARERAAERKLEGARNPGTLNPKGRGGPIYEQMVTALEQLGTKDDVSNEGYERQHEKVAHIREMFERKLRKQMLNMYNEHIEGKKGALPYDAFEHMVEDSFRHGYNLYLKAALRLDMDDAPDPHEPYTANLGGGKRTKWTDEDDKDHYLRKYIELGSDVTHDLPRSPKEHNFDPANETEGYATKYQNSSGKESVDAALDAYMFEKLRLYTNDYTAMLDEALRRGVKPKKAIDLAQYVYGNDAAIFAETESYEELDPEYVAEQSIANRARVRVPFEKYMERGEALETQYPYDPRSGSWVTSPHMIRDLIFKYPQTVEQGLAIVDRDLPRLLDTYPDVPRRRLINMCVKAPDTYEQEIRTLLQNAKAAMEQYPVNEIFSNIEFHENVFSYFKVDGAFVTFFVGNDQKKIPQKLSEILGTFAALSHELDKAGEEHGRPVTYSEQHRVLRSLLTYNASPSKILQRELRRVERAISKGVQLYERAESEDPVFGSYVVDLGFGEDEKEILERGRVAVDFIIEQYGKEDAETFLSQILEMYYVYYDKGFSSHEDKLPALKDALVMDPYNTKHAFEHIVQGGTWPEEVLEIAPSEQLRAL